MAGPGTAWKLMKHQVKLAGTWKEGTEDAAANRQLSLLVVTLCES